MADPGAKPMPHHPYENEGPRILGATMTVTVLAMITMIARLFVRLRIIQNVGWDDYMMIFAMTLSIAGQCLIFPQVYYGGGKHIEYIAPKDFQTAFKLNFATQPIYLIAICVVKESIGFFLLRIAVTKVYKRIISGIMAFMAFYTIGCFFTIVLQCTNLAVQWDPTVKGTCWTKETIQTLSYTNLGFNITTDLLFAVFIPIPMLWHVQMNRRQKSTIVGILGLGIFATAAALVKTTYVSQYGKQGDWLWDSRNITIWTVVESNTGIIAGNLPCLKPLFRSVLGATYGRGSRNPSKNISRTYGGGYGGGTGLNNAKKNGFSSLTSSKARDIDAYSPKDEVFVMTTIGADKQRAGSPASNGLDSDIPGKNSEESILSAKEQQEASNSWKLGGIMRTTEVSHVSHTSKAGLSSPSGHGHGPETRINQLV
ncbi:hypothetical protein DM02DRAFT_612305 [Periconia macrospinosa]|uniref:Rhodopsin domain-containing protein n=1 Tax=Periconia macrospinosa TaxID=97972 RepID=A0A2V1E150_9PLEO|nr:hypothetical protein DM02DRAFT_612305 [Periconia macrospinosa]